MNSSKKFRLIIFLASLTALAPLATDMYLPALPLMNTEFNVGTLLIQMTLSKSGVIP